MANWKEPKNDYKKEDQVVPEIFNTLAENERYLQEKKITTEQVQDAVVSSTQATSRTTIGGSETVKGFFGKVRKWLADLKALAFKKTVATADIDDSAVTDAKIQSVAASKVTGLHKVATSGDYNDLINKPSSGGGGGFNFKKYVFYAGDQPSGIEDGIYLASAIFTNAGSYSNTLSFGTIALNKDLDNGAFSNISSTIFDGEEIKVQLHASYYNGKYSFSVLQSDGEKSCPYKGFEGDGSFAIFLFKLSDLGTISLDDVDESGGSSGGTWKMIYNDLHQVNSNENKTLSLYIPGLKKGDTVKFLAGGVMLKEDYTNESYFFNSPDGNMVYGYTYDGWSYNELGEQTGWYQLQSEYDYPSSEEMELSSESPYVGKVGLVDYTTSNKLTIKVSCKQDNYLTIEVIDTAGFYIESMMITSVQAKR